MIHNTSIVSESSVIEDSADIGPYVVIEDGVYIGENVKVFAGAHIGRKPMGAGIMQNSPKSEGSTSIGAGSVIGSQCVVYAGVELAGNNLLGDGVRIRENSTVGEGTVIGSNSTVQNGATIGSRVKIVDLSHITFDCEIGDDSFISVGVYTMNDNSMAQGGEVVGPKVGKRVRIGGGAMLLPGVRIGDDAVVGAGAVVTKDVEPHAKVMGVPAADRKKTEQEARNLMVDEFFGRWDFPRKMHDEWPPIG